MATDSASDVFDCVWKAGAVERGQGVARVDHQEPGSGEMRRQGSDQPGTPGHPAATVDQDHRGKGSLTLGKGDLGIDHFERVAGRRGRRREGG